MIIMTALSNGWVTLWVFTATATAMVPVLLPQLSLTMVLPVILAIPHTRSRFLPIMAVTVVMSLLLAWIGCFSPGVGIQEQAPDWLIDVEVIFFVTSNIVICLFVDQLNHAGLTTKSAALRASQARLVAATDRERARCFASDFVSKTRLGNTQPARSIPARSSIEEVGQHGS